MQPVQKASVIKDRANGATAAAYAGKVYQIKGNAHFCNHLYYFDSLASIWELIERLRIV